MRIIISYASAGAGHFKSAQAIYNYFKKKDPSLDIKLVDILQYSGPLLRLGYTKGYSFMVNYVPWLWAFVFYFSSLKLLRPIISRMHLFGSRISAGKFCDLLIEENPDLLISTHFLPSQLTSYLKGVNKISVKLITVITDFVVHPFWVSENTDTYITACGLTSKILIDQGIESCKIREFGIPIDCDFSKGLDRASVALKIGAGVDKFTVLIVTGSFGLGPIEKLVSLLYKDAQLLVVCARNKRLFRKLASYNYPGLKVFGFVDNMAELMSMPDVIITKPGGLSISELLAKELVPIFISSIPGQEQGNVSVLKQYGIGFKANGLNAIIKSVLAYKNDIPALEQIKTNIRKLKKPNSAGDLYNEVCKSSLGPGC